MRKEKKSSTEMNQMRVKTEKYEKVKRTRMKITSQKNEFQLQQKYSDLLNSLQEESKHSESEQSR